MSMTPLGWFVSSAREMAICAGLLTATLFLLATSPLAAEANKTPPKTRVASATQGKKLIASGRERDAIELLKVAIGRHPNAEELRWLLARAYLRDRNYFWAFRTLAGLSQLTPEDCGPLLWTAWIQSQKATLVEARETLLRARCARDTPAETRRALLLAMVEERSGRLTAALEQLASARSAKLIYDEDRTALKRLTASLDPGALPLLTGKLELLVGGTTNARAGSPIDPANLGTDASSPTGQSNLWLRLVGPTGRRIRPSAEIEGRSIGYTADVGRDLSYLAGSIRPGLILGDSAPSGLLAYRFETLLLAGGDRYRDGPVWFSNAHRAEFEIEPTPSVSVFGGLGRRLFREAGRSRTETDGGVGSSSQPIPELRLLGALAGRWHGAHRSTYDLWGGSALLSAEWRLFEAWAVRAGALVGLDWYPHSAGYFDATRPQARRRDTLIKLSTSALSPQSEGVRAGAAYEYSERLSTAAPYRARDHRLLLKLAWSFSADPQVPRPVSPDGHVPLDHAMGASDFDARLGDLLRQDDATQRSSSCVE